MAYNKSKMLGSVPVMFIDKPAQPVQIIDSELTEEEMLAALQSSEENELWEFDPSEVVEQNEIQDELPDDEFFGNRKDYESR